MRFRPLMSTTEFIIMTSRTPTCCLTWPPASVLTISFGTPKGSARMAAVPMVVPAAPPRLKTPSTFPAREGGERGGLRSRRGESPGLAPPSLLGKGAGGLGERQAPAQTSPSPPKGRGEQVPHCIHERRGDDHEFLYARAVSPAPPRP